ncbi:serine/threonine-protein phosphatase 4 regulatory subunit 4-like [Convolutriloba macropyga]|uniref:serine/threonine-protein phosphatase 4 regulatory subunit 4-like n=1 Tax=Convolutriloba macropyga TaxID=536237 RepID=UPI003F520657
MDSLDENFDFEDTYESAVHQIKTADEIKKYVVDEKLTPVERFLHILNKGEDVQKYSALSNVASLIKSCDNKDKEIVLKKVSSFVLDSGEDFNVMMAEQFPILLKESFINELLFLRLLFPTVIQGLHARMSIISQAWNNCLLEVLPFLPKEILKKEVLPIVRKHSDLRQTVQTRTFACRLVSKMTHYYDNSLIMQDLVPIIKHLCQDIEYEVRWNMCVSLVPIVKSIDTETTANTLLPELIELTNDEEKIVKFKALSALVDFVPFLDEDCVFSTVLPTVDRYMESTSLKHDPNIVELSRVFGGLCFQLGHHLSEDQRNYYLSFYRKLSTNGLSDSGSNSEKVRRDSVHLMPANHQKPETDKFVECRQCAAFNFPALLSFCGSSGFSQQLERTLYSLATDPAVSVRKTTAAGFHELVKMMAPKAVVLENILLQLLKDDNLEVKTAITKHLNIVIIYMYDSSISHTSEKCLQDKIVEAIIESYQVLKASHNWRATVTIVKHFCAIPNCFHDDITYKKVYPLLYGIVTSHSSRPIKEAACESLSWLVRSNRKFDQRSEMVASIINNLAASDSSAQRLMFIELCRCFSKHFSRKFFKENFFDHLINLSADKVLDVRLAVSKYLPQVKSMLRLPVDRNLLHKLELAVRSLINQDYQNRQSSTLTSTIRYYTQLCDQQETIVESAIDHVPKTEDDVIDHQKEEEEKLIEVNHKQRRRKTISKCTENGTGAVKTTPGTKSSDPSSNGGSKAKNLNISPTSQTNGISLSANASPLSPPLKSPLSVKIVQSPAGNKSGNNSPSRTNSIKARGSGTSSPLIMKSQHNSSNNHLTPNGLHELRRASMPVALPSDGNMGSKRTTVSSKSSAKK